ncbi:MAG: pseudouridine synthase, partial [Acutalibacteraceae bacterium]
IRLKRVAIGTVKLGMLPPGKWRDLTAQEVKALVMAAQVPQKVAADYIKKGRRPERGGSRADGKGRR